MHTDTTDRTPRPLRLLRSERLTAAALVVLFAAIALGSHLRPTTVSAEPARIATIDLEKAFNSLARYGDGQTALKSLSDSLESQVKAAEDRVKDLEAELDSFAPGSDAQLAAMNQLQEAVGEFRAVQQFAQAKLELERARLIRDTYLAIKDAARRHAEQAGYDYILLDDSLPDMDLASSQKTMAQISARRFIFATPKADVTEALVGMMNGEWSATGATGG
jgi:Skp family chaperone for outer membrane proteins